MTGPERLAKAVFGRRAELGLTRDQVRDRGGPSEPTQRAIELKSSANASASTLAKLDAALEWEPGSAARVLDGGDATARSSDDVRRPFAPGPDEIVVTVGTVVALLSVSGDLDRLSRENEQLPELSVVTERLHKALNPVYGRYVTRLFEENRRANGELSPVFAVFGRLLDQPNDSVEPSEYEERQYRRWLAGRDVGGSDSDGLRYQQRFEQSADSEGGRVR